MATQNIQNIGNFTDSKYATGRRKKSIAKVWLKKGSGNIFVNGKKYDEAVTKRLALTINLCLEGQDCGNSTMERKVNL